MAMAMAFPRGDGPPPAECRIRGHGQVGLRPADRGKATRRSLGGTRRRRGEAARGTKDASWRETLGDLDSSFESGGVRTREEATTSGKLCVLRDDSSHPTPYESAWEEQKRLVSSKCLQLERGQVLTQDLLLVQHEAVYTLGAGSTTDHLLFDEEDPPLPLFRTERGGEVTYHGPGQLVLYPVMDLRSFEQDLHWYMRTLEEVVIRTLGALGLEGERVEGLTGVWVEGKKVAAIGVRAKRWITYHGLALNVTTDLSPFENIVPCGIQDRGVTSVYDLLAGAKGGEKGLDKDALLKDVATELLNSFEELFGVEYCLVD